jgi:hypothetical protein
LRIGQIGGRVDLISAAQALLLLECGVVRHPEDPAAEIGAGFAASQVVKESKKGFLDQFFGILGRDAERKQIAENGSAQFVVKPGDFFFDGRGTHPRTGVR